MPGDSYGHPLAETAAGFCRPGLPVRRFGEAGERLLAVRAVLVAVRALASSTEGDRVLRNCPDRGERPLFAWVPAPFSAAVGALIGGPVSRSLGSGSPSPSLLPSVLAPESRRLAASRSVLIATVARSRERELRTAPTACRDSAAGYSGWRNQIADAPLSLLANFRSGASREAEVYSPVVVGNAGQG